MFQIYSWEQKKNGFLFLRTKNLPNNFLFFTLGNKRIELGIIWSVIKQALKVPMSIFLNTTSELIS